MKKLIDPHRLEVLRELARTGSFSAAADALDYTQSAVSKQIATLEREVGATLVQRQVRPLRLTDAGESLIEHASQILSQLEAAREAIEEIVGLRSGRLRIGAVSSAARTFVADAVVRFRAEAPGVELQVREGGPVELCRMIRDAELDLAVVYEYPGFQPPLTKQFHCVELLHEPDDILLARGSALAARKRIPIDSLRNEDWLVPALGADHPARLRVTAACAEAGFEPRVVFEMNDCQATQALVAAGMGIALMPRAAIHPAHPAVAIRELATRLVPRRIVAVSLPSDRKTPALEKGLGVLSRAAAAWGARGPAELEGSGHSVPAA
jgi:DNA-binding transcriptional LysR family regulator